MIRFNLLLIIILVTACAPLPDSTTVTPTATATDAPSTYCLLDDNVNLRSGPSLAFNVVGVAQHGYCYPAIGTPVITAELSYNVWQQVVISGTPGFIEGSHLLNGPDVLTPTPDPLEACIYDGPLRVRSEPSTEATINGLLWEGNCVVVLDVYQGEGRSWYQTPRGWIAADYVVISSLVPVMTPYVTTPTQER